MVELAVIQKFLALSCHSLDNRSWLCLLRVPVLISGNSSRMSWQACRLQHCLSVRPLFLRLRPFICPMKKRRSLRRLLSCILSCRAVCPSRILFLCFQFLIVSMFNLPCLGSHVCKDVEASRGWAQSQMKSCADSALADQVGLSSVHMWRYDGESLWSLSLLSSDRNCHITLSFGFLHTLLNFKDL